jgi:Ca2+-binding EF-hand superfamily protein
MRRTNAAAEIPLHFCSFHRRFSDHMTCHPPQGTGEVGFEAFARWWGDKSAMERRRCQLVDVFDVVDEGGKGAIPKRAVAELLDKLGLGDEVAGGGAADPDGEQALRRVFAEMQAGQAELDREALRAAFDLVDLSG